MNPTKGYFSLAQYCPDVSRREAANVGVLLFCPEIGFLDLRLIKGNSRVRRFFGEEADNFQHLNAMKDSLLHRIQVERECFVTIEDLRTFVATRAGKVILTEPRPIKIVDPHQDLEALYRELVLEPEKSLTPAVSLPLRERLDRALSGQDVRPFLCTNIKVQMPTFKEAMEVPYGFQNGRFNLIQPIQFTQQSEARVRNAACKTAMEGLSLFRHSDSLLGDLQLVVVAQFTDRKPGTENLVRDILREGSVEMYKADDLEALKLEIISHGRLAPDSSRQL